MKKNLRGSEQEFQAMLHEINKHYALYHKDPKHFNFLRLTEALDGTFDGRYGWSSDEFFKELDTRVSSIA